MNRAERIMAMAVERGPLGVRQHDFDYPARDKGSEVKAISTIITSQKLGLALRYDVDRRPVWFLPEFAPAEHFRTPYRCMACGGCEPADRQSGPCVLCGSGPLLQVRVVEPAETKAAA